MASLLRALSTARRAGESSSAWLRSNKVPRITPASFANGSARVPRPTSIQKTRRPLPANVVVQNRARSRPSSESAVRDCCSSETFQTSAMYRNMRSAPQQAILVVARAHSLVHAPCLSGATLCARCSRRYTSFSCSLLRPPRRLWFSFLSSDRQDRCVLADLLGTGVEQKPAVLHPCVRSPGLRAHSDYPGRKHALACHELHERERMKQATVPRREHVRTQ